MSISLQIRVSVVSVLKIPPSSPLYEFTSCQGNGTTLHVVTCLLGSCLCIVKAEVALPSWYNPLLTALHLPTLIALTMLMPLSFTCNTSIAHVSDGLSVLTIMLRVVGWASGGCLNVV
jgi:hypothetical protein